ncbi:MAG TPA: AarF/ABC1/UbiB kinase family protein [Candidatus Acidoferrales bacterium]|nr:AarF/ABC1/UbiB kinase family protein [Candidatus Acidoferrales bacterium]
MDQQPRKAMRRSRIPSGRLERLARIGWLAGEVTVGGLAEGARRLLGAGTEARNIFVTRTNAERLAKRLSSLRGAAMKLGQLLSLEGDDYLPAEITGALAILRADAHAMPDAQLRRVLGHAYGKGWGRRFAHFGTEPVAAASIGQVHHAITTDGRELALKIQYPGVARSIESDVDNLASILRLSRLLPGQLDLSAILTEAKRQLRQEADYRAEAVHLRRYKRLLADERAFVVPGVHDDLTSTHVLAMDYVDGTPLDQIDGAAQPLRDRIGVHLYRLLFRELFEFRFVQTDPNFANFFLLPQTEQIALLDLGAAREVPERLSVLYARLFAATITRDRAALARVFEEIGFIDVGERRERSDALVDFFYIACEPFGHRGVYDFGASDVPPRVRAAGAALTARHGFFRPPPPDTIFLHRKLAGTFLLCARLGARVDVRGMLEPFVARRGSAHASK